jgi:hypothetical protein
LRIYDWKQAVRREENTLATSMVTGICRGSGKTSLVGLVRSDEQGEQRKNYGKGDHGRERVGKS